MGRNEEKKRGQSPFLYFDYSGIEKMKDGKKDGKKGTVPFFFARRVKNADI